VIWFIRSSRDWTAWALEICEVEREDRRDERSMESGSDGGVADPWVRRGRPIADDKFYSQKFKSQIAIRKKIMKEDRSDRMGC
jgi:hypothetical protein